MSYTTAPYEKIFLAWADTHSYSDCEPVWSADLSLIQSVTEDIIDSHPTHSLDEKLDAHISKLISKYSLSLYERKVLLPFGRMTISYSAATNQIPIDSYLGLHNEFFNESGNIGMSVITDLGEYDERWKQTNGELPTHTNSFVMHYLPKNQIPFECYFTTGDFSLEKGESIFAGIASYVHILDEYAKNPRHFDVKE